MRVHPSRAFAPIAKSERVNMPRSKPAAIPAPAMQQAAKLLSIFALERRYDEIEADLRKLLRKHRVTWRHGEGIVPWKDSPKELLDCNQALEAVYALRGSLSAPPSDRDMEIRNAQLWGNILGQTLQRLRLRSLTDREEKRTRNSGEATADKWKRFHPGWLKQYRTEHEADPHERSLDKLARRVANNSTKNPRTNKPFHWRTVYNFLKPHHEKLCG